MNMHNTEIKVTKINNKYHIRLFVDGSVHEEQACQLKSDIGVVARSMLRWFDKGGGCSMQAHNTRKRMNAKFGADPASNKLTPVGKVWNISLHGKI